MLALDVRLQIVFSRESGQANVAVEERLTALEPLALLAAALQVLVSVVAALVVVAATALGTLDRAAAQLLDGLGFCRRDGIGAVSGSPGSIASVT